MQQSNTYKFANSPLLAFQKDLTGPSIAFENVSLRKKNLNAATPKQYNWQWSSLLEGNLEVDNAFQPQ